MDVRQVVGILIIMGAYGLTWFFLLRSLRIVRIIDQEGLDHAGEIKARLKNKRAAAAPKESGETDAAKNPGERNGSDPGGR